MNKETDAVVSRRKYLTAAATGATLLAGGAVSLPAGADEGKDGGDTLYGHGMVWNRDLPNVQGSLRLSFDLRLNLVTGIGFGTAEDPMHPDWNLHFTIGSVAQEKRPKGETRYTLTGQVVEANNPANVGATLALIAETVGDTTAVAIRLGDLAFAGAGIVIKLTLLDQILLAIIRSL